MWLKVVVIKYSKALQNVLGCYPQASLKTSAEFFDVYHLGPQALETPLCFSPAIPETIQPDESNAQVGEQPITFQWDTNNISTTGFAITLERKLKKIFWIEGEDFQGEGWNLQSSYVGDFNGAGFLEDGWQAGKAAYLFDVPIEDKYKVWVRFYKRRENDQRNFIDLARQSLEFASGGSILDQWIWKDIGTFDLPAGQLPLELSRTYGKDEEYSVFIDAIAISSDLNYVPENADSQWQTIKSTGEIDSEGTEYRLGKPLPPGEYRWKVRVYDANRIVDPDGERGIESDMASFKIP